MSVAAIDWRLERFLRLGRVAEYNSRLASAKALRAQLQEYVKLDKHLEDWAIF